MSVPLTDDMRQQADKLKNEGNEFVKQEKFKEALDAYNAAIKIDPNNTIYYCNRLVSFSSIAFQFVFFF
jgi:tetratricopeptide (TPR) repeat protein